MTAKNFSKNFCKASLIISFFFISSLPAFSLVTEQNDGLGVPEHPVAGNPINPANGNKFQIERDYLGSGIFPLEMTRVYNSSKPSRAGGSYWKGTYDRSVAFVQDIGFAYVRLFRQDGKSLRYEINSATGNPIVNNSLSGSLVRLTNAGATSGWKYTDADDNVETYDATGRLESIANRAGFIQQLVYDTNNRLSTVTDPAGRQLTFLYDAVTSRCIGFRDPANNLYTYAFDTEGRLASVTYPDNTSRQYVYNEQDFTQATQLPNALTGLIDEKGIRFATWKYDAQGRAISSEHTGGIELTTLSYDTDLTDVTTPLGNVLTYTYQRVNGVQKNASMSNVGCNCSQSAASHSYDVNGFLTQTTDFNGNLTNYTRDSKGRILTQTNSDTSTVTYQWHSTFNLPLSIAEQGRTTTFTYNSDGNPLTKTITSGTKTRKWTYTYTNKLLTKIDGPRTDVSDFTNIAYDAQQRITSVTNALGYVTLYSGYDAHGSLTSVTDPNGLVTTFTYDLRGRLTKQKNGTLETRYEYDNAGNLVVVYFPETTVFYTYDNAHRLTKVTDSLGNFIEYQLDGAGNRIQENVRDSANTLFAKVNRTYNTLSKLVSITDGLGKITTLTYDDQGSLATQTDPLINTTTYFYDSMNRLSSVTDPLTNSMSLGYSLLGEIQNVTDANGNVTDYTLNGLNDQTQLQSPDTGSTVFTYDAAGNVLTQTDARGKKTTYVYDALNRMTKITYADATVVTIQYDTGTNALGRLNKITDPSGNTSWSYDQLGRVISKTQTIGTIGLTTQYTYDLQGRLATQTHPSGKVLSYTYNQDKITKLSLDGATVVDNVSYQPFGDVKQFTFGNADNYVRNYDLAGRTASYGLATAIHTITYDNAGQITKVSNGTAAGTSDFAYETTGKLAQYKVGTTTEDYVYDANGNRTESILNGQSTIYSYTPGNILADMTNPAGVTKTFLVDAAGNITKDASRTYTYNAAGRMIKAVKGSITTNYTYNGSGQRVKKSSTTASVGTTLFVYNEKGQMIGEYSSTGALVQETIWLNDTPVATVRAASINFIVSDHLNTPREIYNSSKQLVWRWRTDAWGLKAVEDNPSALGKFNYHYRFPGQYYDLETGIHQNYFRDYDPSVGRYIESDPIGLKGGINTYLYVKGSPLLFVDYNGLSSITPEPGSALCAALQALANNPNNTWITGNGDFSFNQLGSEQLPGGRAVFDGVDIQYVQTSYAFSNSGGSVGRQFAGLGSIIGHSYYSLVFGIGVNTLRGLNASLSETATDMRGTLLGNEISLYGDFRKYVKDHCDCGK